MKFVFAVLMIVGGPAMAQQCQSSLMVQPWSICQDAANGVEDAVAPEDVGTPASTVIQTGGGQDLHRICDGWRASLNHPDGGTILSSRPLPDRELPNVCEGNVFGRCVHVTYQYQCAAQPIRYQAKARPSPQCPRDPNAPVALVTPGSPLPRESHVSCLTCDNVQDTGKLLACVYGHAQRLWANQVQLNPSDAAAMAKTVQEMVQNQRTFGTYGQDRQALSQLAELNSLFPAQ